MCLAELLHFAFTFYRLFALIVNHIPKRKTKNISKVKNILEILLANFRQALSPLKAIQFMELFIQTQSRNLIVFMLFTQQILSQSRLLNEPEWQRVENIFRSAGNLFSNNNPSLYYAEKDVNMLYFLQMNALTNQKALNFNKQFLESMKKLVESSFILRAPKGQDLESFRFCLEVLRCLRKLKVDSNQSDFTSIGMKVNDVVEQLVKRARSLKIMELRTVLEGYRAIEFKTLSKNHIFKVFENNYEILLNAYAEYYTGQDKVANQEIMKR